MNYVIKLLEVNNKNLDIKQLLINFEMLEYHQDNKIIIEIIKIKFLLL